MYYKGLNPITLHKAGLEDGRHSKENLLKLLTTDESYIETKARIVNTALLLAKEVSMLSEIFFGTVGYVCRKLKNDTKIVGGMQVVLSGDCYQLPPIKSTTT